MPNPAPPSWQTLRLADAPKQPWKNGGGFTRELLRWPQQGEDWRVRLSVADIERDGAFSHFVGVQRWFAVLQGRLCLDIHGTRHELDPSSAPLVFDGAAPAYCTLRSTASQDFNLMLRAASGSLHQGAWQGKIQPLDHAQSPSPSQNQTPSLFAVYAADGGAQVSCNDRTLNLAPHSLTWCWVTDALSLNLSGTQLLWLQVQL